MNDDLDKITSALHELFVHLRDRYDISEELSKGAETMTQQSKGMQKA